MLKYSPFDCDLADVNEDKLNLLLSREVTEGWYVEFKSQLVLDGKKIAKSISSFANAKGGWYIMGVESDNKTNRAVKIDGIDITSWDKIVDQINDLIIGNISPAPSFEIKLVKLESEKVVIINSSCYL
ncbi:MAG: ATP-binding protein [Bacteroidota bacterium]